MKDPYQILGVSPQATDDEVKAAYRALARKYHPDKYRDTDLAEMATEKMKEVNAAYEEIQKMRAAKTSGQSTYGQNTAYGTGGYAGGHAGTNSNTTSPYLHARRLINMRRFLEAEQVLSTVPAAERGAEWHFLMGSVAYHRGFFVDAQQYFDTACGMDPDNQEYRAAQEHLRGRAAGFGGGQTTRSSCSLCDVCCAFMCADCCCDAMGSGC